VHKKELGHASDDEECTELARSKKAGGDCFLLSETRCGLVGEVEGSTAVAI
jgi:hypothetical protein